MEFERSAEHQRAGWGGGVKLLEKAAAEDAVINHAAVKQNTELRRRINAAAPDAPAEGIEVFRMLCGQQGLGLAVALLLLEIGLDRRAAVIPDETRRAETNPVAAFLQAPADVHVIPRFAIDRIEAADFVQGPFVECHVAT